MEAVPVTVLLTHTQGHNPDKAGLRGLFFHQQKEKRHPQKCRVSICREMPVSLLAAAAAAATESAVASETQHHLRLCWESSEEKAQRCSVSVPKCMHSCGYTQCLYDDFSHSASHAAITTWGSPSVGFLLHTDANHSYSSVWGHSSAEL